MYKLKRFARHAGNHLAELLGWDMMSEAYHALVANFVLQILYTTVESTFVNTLLYTVDPSISIVILYRAIMYTTIALTMHLAAYIGQRRTPLTSIRMGAAFYMLAWTLLFLGLSHMRQVMVPAAVLSGLGAAFYWVGHNQLVPRYTSQANREVGISIIGVVQGVTQLLVPLVSGYVIRFLPGNSGYRVMFGISMAAAVIQLFVQRRMVPVEQPVHVSKLRLALKLLLKKRTFQQMFAFEALRGVREGAFSFLLNMLLFEIITDESLVGINTFLTGAAAILSSWVYGKAVRRKQRGRAVMLASVVLTATCVPLYFIMRPATLMLFTVISSFFTLFVSNACSNTVFDIMCQNATTRKCMGEVVAIRENALWLGRMAGFAVLMFFPHNQVGYMNSILILTLAQFLCGFVMSVTMRGLGRKAAAPTRVEEPV